MEQYINKSVVIAEIESYINSFCDRNGYLEDAEINGMAYETLCDLKNSINTLEVKEVDLEKEIKKYFDSQPILTRSKGIDYQLIPTGVNIAKHFFELGLKAQKVA